MESERWMQTCRTSVVPLGLARVLASHRRGLEATGCLAASSKLNFQAERHTVVLTCRSRIPFDVCCIDVQHPQRYRFSRKENALMRVPLLLLIVLGASASVLAEDNWSQFRGASGDGHAQATGLPLKWSEREHVAWKTPIHDRGWSSPVIWRNQIWLTTATADGHKLFAVCIDRETGKILHDVHVFDVEQPQHIAASNSYASPTSVIEEGALVCPFWNVRNSLSGDRVRNHHLDSSRPELRPSGRSREFSHPCGRFVGRERRRP